MPKFLRYWSKYAKMNNLEVSGTLFGGKVTLKRVSKRLARKLWLEYKTVYMLPCKVHPFNEWCLPYLISDRREDFDKLVNAFEDYNCGSELGYYASFYIKL